LKSLIRVAFPIVSSRAWQGGFNYQLNLVRLLAAHVADRIQAVACFGEDTADEDVAAFAASVGIEILRDGAFSRAGQGARLMRALFLGLDKDAAAAFDARDIDVVFESARYFGRRLPQATIAWFPDFQHRRLPQLFSRAARWRRDIGFRMQLRHGRAILLSSEDARNDCERYYVHSKGMTRVLRFPAMIVPADLAVEPLAVRVKYGLPERFIYLPNQFWRHKNHAVVVEALGILSRRGVVVRVVATGNTHDPRDPSLFKGLLERLDALGASTLFHSLGIIPRQHVIALMRICSAFLNPSMCEGWSSSVEEAKFFGVPMILSDLTVHREQAGEAAQYFATEDATGLADLLAGTIAKSGAINAPRFAAADACEREKAYAEAFATIISDTYMAKRE
jgi:glycosyltransferase involved in cell wall biosynthesis